MQIILSGIVILWLVRGTKLDASESNLKDIFVFPKDVKSSSVSRVIGGENVSPHSYPYQAALYITTTKSQYFCSGTLIETNWILTAAHCVDNFLYVYVYLGSHNLSDTEDASRQVYYSDKVVVHENWNEDTFQNDIALIKLPETVILNDYVSLVDIGLINETYVGVESTIIGWGATETAASSNILKKVEVDVLSNDECKSTNDNYNSIIKDTHLCTSGIGIKGSCSGDSGGPLIVNNSQIGIVSFGPNNCLLSYPSVFTRVSKFSDWIEYAKLNDGSKASAQVILLSLLISFSICIVF